MEHDKENNTGYGNAGRQLVSALTRNGASFSKHGSVALNFCMPPEYIVGDKLTIGYTPWESTKLRPNWILPMRGVDDLWTTSHWVADIFDKEMGRKPWVLPHGLETFWEPHLRVCDDVFVFLHVGGNATRKGADIMLQAWHRAFGHRKDCLLVFKTSKFVNARIYDRGGSIVASPASFDNVKVIDRVLDPLELLDLYYRCHCLVSTSRGEGFGLPAFEFIGSGGPTIVPNITGYSEFSQYAHTLNRYSLVESTAPWEHPGEWYDYEIDEIVANMQNIVDNRDREFIAAFENGCLLHESFDWNSIAMQALARIDSLL